MSGELTQAAPLPENIMTKIALKQISLLLFVLALCCLPIFASSDKITKELIDSQGKTRAYYLFVPASAKVAAPLIVLLHGSGRNGISLVEKWKDLASKEGIILVGPDAQDSKGWTIPGDGPDFLHELVEYLKTKYPINPRRIYLFGHSAGAVFALNLAMFESEYFAATAIHAGAWREQSEFDLMELSKCKMPLAIFVGDSDQFFPLTAVKATEEGLKGQGFTVEVTIIKGHDHFYYDLAPKINAPAWEFLRKNELATDPHYEQYQFGSSK